MKNTLKNGFRKMGSLLLCSMMLSAIPVNAAEAQETEVNAAEAQETEVSEAEAQESPAVVKENTMNQDMDIESILEGMTLEEKIGQMMLPSFRVWKEEEVEGGTKTVENAEGTEPINITELNDEIRECIAKYHFGGIVLFGENFSDPEQTLRLTADMQAVNQESGGLPLLISTDQEGGYIVRVQYGTTGIGNMALAATGDPENAKTMASIYGQELSLLGIHADYGPVMDINNNPDNPVIGVRSFADSPETVAEYGVPFIEGLHEAGVMATLKHFPGHGNTDTDSHTGFPCIQSTYDELKAFELMPFQAAIDAGADMIMTAHIQYPNIETNTCTSISTGEEVYLPATMSHTILTDILRGDMGFEGVVVTDALDMAAITDNFSKEDMLCLAVNAGANMLLLPTIQNTTIFHETEDLVDLAIQLAEEGRIEMECIDDSVRRILTLKKAYGLLDETDFEVTEEKAAKAVDGIGTSENRETAWNLAMKSLTVLNNENDAFPLTLKDDETTLILFADSCASRAGAGELAKKILQEQGIIADGEKVSVLVNTAENEEECLQAAKDADHVILVHRMYASSNLDPGTDDGFSSGVFDRIIEERHTDGKQVILVSGQLPYDAARFTDADAIVLTYGSYVMRELPPETGNGSGYMPNLPAALCACFGMGEAAGKLPVTIYTLDENYQITDEPIEW